MACRLLFIVGSFLASRSNAFAPAPIQWAKAPGQGLALMPTSFSGHHLRSFALPQKLTLGETTKTMMPYFTAKADHTISVGGWCVEAAGQKSGDEVIVNSCSGGPSQQWNWIPDGHGRNMIQLKDTSLCLDVDEKASSLNGAAVELQQCEYKSSETWMYEEPMPVPSEDASIASDARHVMMALISLAGVGGLSLVSWLWQRHSKAPLVAGGMSFTVAQGSGVAMTEPMAFTGGTGGSSARSPFARTGVVRMSGGDVTYDDLVEGGVIMTESIIEAFKDDDDFMAASEKQLEMLLARDAEDAEKLQAGIDLAIAKGVLDAEVTVEPVQKVNVTGKTPEEAAEEIMVALGDAPEKGCVLTIQGLSGLGKGTTSATLELMLPKAQAWSNGNIFRTITLLATRYAIQEKFTAEEREKYKYIITDLQGEGALKDEFDERIQELLTPEIVLSKQNLATFMGMLSFDMFRYEEFDTKIEGLGMEYFVSDIRNTLLKTMSPFVPAVAEVIQGEVITFIKAALDKLTACGCNVLLEGREQTLNYIRTPHRFELVIDDNNVIGMRQAALLMGSSAKQRGVMDDAAVTVALYDELSNLPT